MPVRELAKRCGIARNWLYRKLINDGVRMAVEDRQTGNSVRRIKTVPLGYANKLIRRYEAARRVAAETTPTT